MNMLFRIMLFTTISKSTTYIMTTMIEVYFSFIESSKQVFLAGRKLTFQWQLSCLLELMLLPSCDSSACSCGFAFTLQSKVLCCLLEGHHKLLMQPFFQFRKIILAHNIISSSILAL